MAGHEVSIPVMQPHVGSEEADAAAAVIASGWLAQGPKVEEFERAVAGRVGADQGVALSSGTAALHLALTLAGVGPGDDVIVPSLSHIATTNAVTYTGASPVFADVELATQNMTVDTIRTAWTATTKAVIAVDQAGTPADIDPIAEHCRAAGARLIEDAACALGSVYRGCAVGSRCGLVAVSFHPRKVITTGEGGMLLSADLELADRARRLRDHGVSDAAWSRHRHGRLELESYGEIGFNYRMSDVQAAIGLVQLERLGQIVERRRSLASRYHQLLGDIPGVAMARDPDYGETNFQSFWVLLGDEFPLGRDDLLTELAERGVSARRGIMAAHREPAFADLHAVELAATEILTDRSLILPMYHSMRDDDQLRVAAVIRELAGRARGSRTTPRPAGPGG